MGSFLDVAHLVVKLGEVGVSARTAHCERTRWWPACWWSFCHIQRGSFCRWAVGVSPRLGVRARRHRLSKQVATSRFVLAEVFNQELRDRGTKAQVSPEHRLSDATSHEVFRQEACDSQKVFGRCSARTRARTGVAKDVRQHGPAWCGVEWSRVDQVPNARCTIVRQSVCEPLARCVGLCT